MQIKTIENIDFISGELWAVIPNYSQYLISNYGRIYSLKRKAIKFSKKMSLKKKKRRNKNKNPKKYLMTRLYDDSGVLSNSLYIHRLVAEVFCTNNAPESKTEVHHKDVNSLNNRADNLVWLTPEEHREIHTQLRKERENNEA